MKILYFASTPFYVKPNPSFHLMSSKGRVSKIVPLLDEGAAVTTLRTDVDYVVTEYGIARLRGDVYKRQIPDRLWR